MSKQKQSHTAKRGFFATIGRWAKRMFFGASKELSEDDVFAVEKIESPSRMTVKAFFRRKLAVVALIVLLALFLFVFIGPYFFPMDLNYSDHLQKNMAPNYSLRKVPAGLKDNIQTISGFSDFTVGVSKDHTFYIWGNTKNTLTNTDYTKFPAEIQPGKVAFAAAGSDHIIAITTDGQVVGWGNSNNGQYGALKPGDEAFYTQMPDFLLNGTINPDDVQKLVCGYQCTALLMKDGNLYVWGNHQNIINMRDFTKDNTFNTGIKDVVLSNNYILALREDGSVTGGTSVNGVDLRQSAVLDTGEKIKSVSAYLSDGHKAVALAATDYCYAMLMENGHVVVFGADKYGEKTMPAGMVDDEIVGLTAGTRHFLAVGASGTTYAWGHNDGGQCNVNGKTASQVFAGAKQSYLVSEDGELTASSGFKGYLMGTDSMGRDILTRIVHGGKMTMTIGAVAVIVSTVIAIIVGCLSGYFGGWVDMLLMRITEICSSIPFLPFAMMLSYVISTKPISETTRILIIMVMLGLLSWTGLARMIRAQVLAEREKEFVVAAQAMGVKEKSIAFKHILPNVISVILVSVTLDFAGCMLTESSLSYLGFGVQQPQPTWGNMLDGANNSLVIQNYWWQWVFPSIFLSIATISINIIGDTLRDVLDPKSSREK